MDSTGHSPAALARNRAGFTLIELLIVVAIIAVLVAMLLPMVNRTNGIMQLMVCQNNLRSIAAATTLYAMDNNKSYPYPAVNLMPEDWVYWQQGRSLNTGGIIRYLSTSNPSSMLICPRDSVAIHANGYPFSYSININLAGYWPAGDWPNPCSIPTLKMSQVKHPANCILFIDESELTVDDGCWAWQSDDGSGVNVLANRHDEFDRERPVNPDGTVNINDPSAGRGNVSYCDGHVAFTSRKDSWNPIYYDPKQ